MLRSLGHVVGVLSLELLAAGAFLTLWSARLEAERSVRPPVAATSSAFQFGVQPWTTARPAPLYYWSQANGETPRPAPMSGLVQRGF